MVKTKKVAHASSGKHGTSHEAQQGREWGIAQSSSRFQRESETLKVDHASSVIQKTAHTQDACATSGTA